METKTIKLTEVIVPDEFKGCIPSPKKFGKKLSYYKWTKRFDKQIIINTRNVLLDGYITYLIAKTFDVSEIEVGVEAEHLE